MGNASRRLLRSAVSINRSLLHLELRGSAYPRYLGGLEVASTREATWSTHAAPGSSVQCHPPKHPGRSHLPASSEFIRKLARPRLCFAPYHRKPRPESSKSLTASSFSAACMKCSGAARERGRHKMCSLEFGTAQRSKKHGKSISIIISPQMWLILDFLEIP